MTVHLPELTDAECTMLANLLDRYIRLYGKQYSQKALFVVENIVFDCRESVRYNQHYQ